MQGWAKLTVAGIVLFTLGLSVAAIYVRYGRPGLMIVGLLAVLMVFATLVEGIGPALLTCLLDRIWRDPPVSK